MSSYVFSFGLKVCYGTSLGIATFLAAVEKFGKVVSFHEVRVENVLSISIAAFSGDQWYRLDPNPTRKLNLHEGIVPDLNVDTQPCGKFMKLIESTQESGLVDCDFTPCRTFQDMEFLIGSERIRYVPNAGGNSVNSEVLSFELLGRCFGARLVKTEMEVSYFPQGGSITDYVTEIGGTVLGVSVTRAMKYFGEYTDEDAHHLLIKKLRGVNQSTRNTCESWTKQILHVWTTSAHVTDVITRVYNQDIPEELKSNTLVLVSTASRSDFIFNNS